MDWFLYKLVYDVCKYGWNSGRMFNFVRKWGKLLIVFFYIYLLLLIYVYVFGLSFKCFLLLFFESWYLFVVWIFMKNLFGWNLLYSVVWSCMMIVKFVVFFKLVKVVVCLCILVRLFMFKICFYKMLMW